LPKNISLPPPLIDATDSFTSAAKSRPQAARVAASTSACWSSSSA
jgi:hypothetical protein